MVCGVAGVGRLAILHKGLWDPGERVEQLHALWGLGTGAQQDAEIGFEIGFVIRGKGEKFLAFLG